MHAATVGLPGTPWIPVKHSSCVMMTLKHILVSKSNKGTEQTHVLQMLMTPVAVQPMHGNLEPGAAGPDGHESDKLSD